jgi:DNA repair photolyase
LDDVLARVLEPKAPTPSKRLKAIEKLVAHGVPVTVRVDPVIPTLNDNPAKLLSMLACLGVKHITSSTYKVKRDNWMRLAQTLPKTAEDLAPLYFEQGERAGGSTLLPQDLRFKLMKNIRDLAVERGLQFGVCREGLAQLNTASCDGSWPLPKAKEAKVCRIA